MKNSHFICSTCLFVSVLAIGCATCEPIIEYQEVLVEVPIATPGPELPVPERLQCGNIQEDNWRNSALFVKECFDASLAKLEEYHHIISSYNESRTQ